MHRILKNHWNHSECPRATDHTGDLGKPVYRPEPQSPCPWFLIWNSQSRVKGLPWMALEVGRAGTLVQGRVQT